MIGFSKRHRRRQIEDAAHELYVAAVEQARNPDFYLRLGVSDSVDGRFDLLSLHVFLLLNRLGRGGEDLRPLSQAVFDLMFADMDQNLRELGVSDIGVGGRVKTMASAFYGRVSAYEPGLADAGVLAAGLARNLYRGSEVPPSVLSAMAAYVLREAAALAEQADQDIKEGRVRFGAPIAP